MFHPRSPRGIADELFGPALPWLPATGPALAQQGHAANLGLQAAQYVKEQSRPDLGSAADHRGGPIDATGLAARRPTWNRQCGLGGSLVRLTRLHGLVGELVEAKGADSARIWLRAGQPAPITLLASGSDADLDRFEDALEELLDAEHAPRRARLLAALAARSQDKSLRCTRPSRRSLMPRASAIPSTTRPSSRIRRQSRNSPDGTWSSGTTTTRRICPASRATSPRLRTASLKPPTRGSFRRWSWPEHGTAACSLGAESLARTMSATSAARIPLCQICSFTVLASPGMKVSLPIRSWTSSFTSRVSFRTPTTDLDAGLPVGGPPSDDALLKASFCLVLGTWRVDPPFTHSPTATGVSRGSGETGSAIR